MTDDTLSRLRALHEATTQRPDNRFAHASIIAARQHLLDAVPALLAVAEAARVHAEECEAEGNGGMNTVPTELRAAHDRRVAVRVLRAAAAWSDGDAVEAHQLQYGAQEREFRNRSAWLRERATAYENGEPVPGEEDVKR